MRLRFRNPCRGKIENTQIRQTLLLFVNYLNMLVPEEENIVEGNVRTVPVHGMDEGRVVDLGANAHNCEHGKPPRVPSVLINFHSKFVWHIGKVDCS